MAGIQTFLNKILSEPYIEKMRQAIHDGIEKTYEDATFDGNTNMEVARARGMHNTLNNRLDHTDRTKADQSFVDAQLASIVSGAPKGTFSNLSSLREAYPNGTDGIFLVLSNGNWYYWNDDQNDWLSGGVYQSISWTEFLTESNQEWSVG